MSNVTQLSAQLATAWTKYRQVVAQRDADRAKVRKLWVLALLLVVWAGLATYESAWNPRPRAIEITTGLFCQ